MSRFRPRLFPMWIGAAMMTVALLFTSVATTLAAPLSIKGAENMQMASQSTLNQDDERRLTAKKSVRTPSDLVRPGDVVHYQIELAYNGDASVIDATLVDELPRRLRLVGRPELTVESPRVSPQEVTIRDHKIAWSGQLTPGAKMVITYPMKARFCIDGQTHRVENTVGVRLGDDATISDTAAFALQCPEFDPNAIEISRKLLDADDSDSDADMPEADTPNAEPTDSNSDDPSTIDSTTIRIQTTFTNHLEIPIVLGLRSFDVVVPAESEETDEVDAASALGQSDRTNQRKLALGPGETRSLIHEVELPEGVEVDDLTEIDIISELEYCLIGEEVVVCTDGDEIHRVRPLRIRIRHRDLGDAPDSSNHAGVRMEAYAGTKGLFPTVYNPTTGRPPGPAHLFPGPFHLGQNVSREVEADRGRDADPFNNLLPRRDQANLDRYDDGLRPHALELVDCQTTTMKVAVTISPRAVAYLRQQSSKGYLNMWLDSNRDGDWEDIVDCPVNDGGAAHALEHILVDHEVDAVALGAGTHVIEVTTGYIPWPEKYSDRSVWMRTTLSERKANKTLSINVSDNRRFDYGDGRGYAAPFVLGETEDYKFRLGELVDGADVVVHKRGAARKEFRADPNGERDEILGRTHWHIRYYNQGLDTANDTVIVDTLPEELDLNPETMKIRTAPEVPFAVDGNKVAFRVGELESGRGGHIVISANYMLSGTQAITITNRAAISATNDTNLENNRDGATVQLGLHAPVITSPGNGTTCNGELEVRGKARPNVNVDLYLNDELIASITADENGVWQHDLSLEDGTHELYAVANYGDISSIASRAKTVIVDSTLAYDPLSIRFIDENGNHRRPRDENGRTDADGWGLHLRPNTDYTVSLRLCCSDSEASSAMDIPGVGIVNLTFNEERDRFVGTFTTGDLADEPVEERMSISVTCDGIALTFDGTILIDPEGVVTDATTGALLSGAMVSCMEAQPVTSADSNAPLFTLWDAAAFEQVNPQTTLDDGYFSFWTPAGTYQLTVAREGYQDYRSEEIIVVDELVRHDVALSPIISDEADQIVEVTESGFSPSVITVQPGAVVEWANMDLDDHTVTANTPSYAEVAGMSSANWHSGLLAAGESYKVRFDTEGTFSYIDSESGLSIGTVIVSASASENSETAEEDDGENDEPGTAELPPATDGQMNVYLPIVQE